MRKKRNLRQTAINRDFLQPKHAWANHFESFGGGLPGKGVGCVKFTRVSNVLEEPLGWPIRRLFQKNASCNYLQPSATNAPLAWAFRWFSGRISTFDGLPGEPAPPVREAGRGSSFQLFSFQPFFRSPFPMSKNRHAGASTMPYYHCFVGMQEKRCEYFQRWRDFPQNPQRLVPDPV